MKGPETEVHIAAFLAVVAAIVILIFMGVNYVNYHDCLANRAEIAKIGKVLILPDCR